ncbi:glycoside hydrolase family 25 protein [Lachnospiraceae bacterium C1.1]|nr:glycoside hydrolase family 25 protein [Lachnospiraceae bacterium C1.1]
MSMLHKRKSDRKKGISSGVKLALATMAALGAVFFVIIATVLANRRPSHKAENTEVISTEAAVNAEKAEEVEWESLADGETRTSDELNFWHMYDKDEPDSVTVSPASRGEVKDDLVSVNKADENVESPSENEIDAVGDESAQAVSRNSLSGNFFDQNELIDGEADFVPVISEIKKSSLYEEGFRMNGEFKEYALNDKKTSFTGIDVSKYQGDIDWKAVADSGVDFAMIRMGSRGYSRGQVIVDDKFYDNLNGCSENGIRVGIYFYSQAITPEEAIEEANYCIGSIGKHKVEYPIVFDSEAVIGDSYRTENLSPYELSSIAQAFCNMVTMYGYTPMIAASKKQFASHFDMSMIEQYDWWLFDTDEYSVFPYKYSIWQYSKTGTVEGISGAVNLDISFIDYSSK